MAKRTSSLTQEKNWNGQPVTAEFDYVDRGIGNYEFWGARGCDIQWGAELLDVKDASGKSIFDDIGEATITKWEEEATEEFRHRESQRDEPEHTED